MGEVLSLFDYPGDVVKPPIRNAHRNDPAPAKEAAVLNVFHRGSERARLLRAFVTFPDGLTDPEAARICGIERVEATRRCSELRNAGLLISTGTRRKTVKGASATVWIPTFAGHQALAAAR